MRGGSHSVVGHACTVPRSELHCSLVEPLFHVAILSQPTAMEVSRSAPFSVCDLSLDVDAYEAI